MLLNSIGERCHGFTLIYFHVTITTVVMEMIGPIWTESRDGFMGVMLSFSPSPLSHALLFSFYRSFSFGCSMSHGMQPDLRLHLTAPPPPLFFYTDSNLVLLEQKKHFNCTWQPTHSGIKHSSCLRAFTALCASVVMLKSNPVHKNPSNKWHWKEFLAMFPVTFHITTEPTLTGCLLNLQSK